MPYVIETKCSGNDNKCVDACPVDCIYPSKPGSKLQTRFYINPEECTNCGACAFACPESAISVAKEYGWYQVPKTVPLAKSLVQLDGTEPSAPGNIVYLNDKPYTWASLMASMAD